MRGVLNSDQRPTIKQAEQPKAANISDFSSLFLFFFFGINAVVGNVISGMEGVVLHMNPAELVASPDKKHILHSSRPPEFGQGKKKKKEEAKEQDVDVNLHTWL